MATHVLTNLDFEYALHHDPRSWQRPPALSALCHRWRAILRLCPGMRDAPLRSLGDPVHPETLSWGVDPRALDADALELARRANSKLTSAALERDLGVVLPHAEIVDDAQSLARIVRALPTDWVLKHPLGVSGRERVLGKAGVLDDRALRWAEKHLARTPLLLEPWVARREDWSVHADLTDDGVVPIGRVTILTDSTGTPRGHVVEPGAPESGPEDAQRAALETLHRWGWRGPVGIDALSGTLGEARVHRPIVEINARFSFGRMALMLIDHAPAGAHLAWLHPRRRQPAPRDKRTLPTMDDGALGAKRRLPEWCDPGGASGTYVVMASSASELADALEDQDPGSVRSDSG